MEVTRRKALKTAAAVAAGAVGPWSLVGGRGYAMPGGPTLNILTRSEYEFINRMAAEIIPDEPVMSGQVDVAGNIDRFYAEGNRSRDFLIMLRFLRLIRLASPALPVIRRASPATYEDIISFKRTVCFLGYYSDANGEADVAPSERVVWPRLGYGGPKDDDWWPPDAEAKLDPSVLVDRMKEAGL